jgi:molybdate transport system ATP-binding protein
MAGELICDCRKRLASGFTLDAALRLPLEEARVTVLFGASGSGKTTLLRLLAGLDTPDSGTIRFRGRVWHDPATHLPPQARRAGFLFQDYALFPHLTVAENVAFAASHDDARRLLSAFELEDLAARRPREVSGGQQQRVALARALAARPELLLLDEPLSALDAAGRARARGELRRILRESGVPSIVVTHDRMEAIALGDWIAVIAAGRIRQAGPVQEVFRRPADAAVAESVGVENIVPAEVLSRHTGLLTLKMGGALVDCVDSGETGPGFACIRAEDVALTREPAPGSARNRLPGTVRAVILEGALARIELDCGFPLVALITAQSATELRLSAGDRVSAVIKATSVHLCT